MSVRKIAMSAEVVPPVEVWVGQYTTVEGGKIYEAFRSELEAISFSSDGWKLTGLTKTTIVPGEGL